MIIPLGSIDTPTPPQDNEPGLCLGQVNEALRNKVLDLGTIQS